MRRHQPPSMVSMWMLDVFCCALGCVTLLWLLKTREAGQIPDEAAHRLDGWAFGCDVCQDVCPWNRKAPPGREPALEARPARTNPDLIEWLGRDPAEFSRAIKGTALARSKRSGLLRNAALILGTRGSLEAVPALAGRLGDADPTVRGALGAREGAARFPRGKILLRGIVSVKVQEQGLE